jgi:general secretion pathway protein G
MNIRAGVRLAARPQPALRKEDGFTLVEMLVVLAIISLIVGLVGPRVLSYLSDSKVKTARIQIENLTSALDLYYLDNGSYPASNLGLTALVQKPGDASNWNGPYLKGTAVPNDPWGHPYLYVFPGQHGNPYDIVSFGADGQEGGTQYAADVASWQR